jgi:hypothetical protein
MSERLKSIAWFSVAALVKRCEIERALHVCRLMDHLVLNTALMAQLEGDVLVSSRDMRVYGAYHKAIALYESNNQIVHALPLYYEMLVYYPYHALLYKQFLQYCCRNSNTIAARRITYHMLMACHKAHAVIDAQAIIISYCSSIESVEYLYDYCVIRENGLALFFSDPCVEYHNNNKQLETEIVRAQ